MVSLKNKSKGFTIVELLIVIVVIGILATLVLVTFTGIQQKARDSKRKTDLGAIQASLESYYSSNNTYPTYDDLNSSTWVSSNMKGFDFNALRDPKQASNASTPMLNAAPGSGVYQYGYVVTPSSCVDDGSGTACSNYTITTNLEGGGTFSKNSNN